MSTFVVARQQADILASLRRLGGRGTVGDVVAESGLTGDAVRDGLKALLESHRGHLEVADSGELVYDFDKRMIERGSEPFLARAWRSVGTIVKGGFKAWIVVMLVVYFVVFVVLVIAAIVAGQRGGDSRGGGWGGGRGGHRGGFPIDPFLLYWIWSPRWRIGRPYYGHRWERTLDRSDPVPFYKKVFAFVFGPDRPDPTQKQLDRRKLRLIRARNGVLTTAELVEHTGSTVPEAEEEMARMVGAYDGEVAVSPEGELVYAFPGLMASVRGGREAREPNPTWLRLEYPRELTGNTAGANAVVLGMNAFTLVAAATAPSFIFPRLGLGGPAAFFGLVVVPLVFSVLFLGGPLVRMAGVKIENRRRASRNVRRVLLGHVFDSSLRGGTPVGVDDAYAFVSTRLSKQEISKNEVGKQLEQLAAEFDADVSPADDGTLRYTFTEVREQFEASDTIRRRLQLDDREIGDIVFATSDTTEEASERDMARFDGELAEAGTDLERYLPAVDRIDFEDDYEVVAFEQHLKRGR